MKNQSNIQPNSVQMIEVHDDLVGQRIDNFLLARLKGVPKSHVYRILRKGEVRVNKGRVKQTYRLELGDIVRIPPLRLAEARPEPKVGAGFEAHLEQNILYEDDQILVINKPSGLAVHGGSGINFGLIEAMRILRPDEKSIELVHRLDRDTSGCILIAKRKSALRLLHTQLRSGQVDKRYLALVAGRWPNRRKTIDAPLKKNELQSGERIVRVSPEGKEAQTEFSVVRRFSDCTLVEARPITGRTHQIRVHAQYAGHGLIGDEKYGDELLNKRMREKGIKRLFLHAASLSFVVPVSGKRICVEAPLSPDLLVALDGLENSSDE